MKTIVDLFVPIDEVDASLHVVAERALGWPRGTSTDVRILRRSLDARKGRPLGYRIRCEVSRGGGDSSTDEAANARATSTSASLCWREGRQPPNVVVVGTGPAGTWAALRLATAGVPVTILERGKPVQPRRMDLANLTRGELNPDSNYCFGEGGAGTYSDGKLYTRSKDRDGIASVLADLVRFGAPTEIEVESRPHVGSNRLPKVLSALRAHLESIGVQYRFESDCNGLRLDRGRVRAVRLRGGDEVPADVVILATGHSSRSTYEWALAAGIAMERKGIAVGVRLEHPQACIDEIQYGAAAGHPRLPPAFYELTAQSDDRGVYSFCMCPGGWIVPAATEAGGVVVNGMSLSKRDSPFANSGLVVSVEPRDFGPDADGPLAGVAFQRKIEEAAFEAGGGKFQAPAQRLRDFIAGQTSTVVGRTSYRPGLVASDMDRVLPPFVAKAMRAGLQQIGKKLSGFLHAEALLIAAETRTSAPIRMPRDAVSLQSISTPGLYPIGEGAGYAGGIVSAALDGIRVANRIVADGNQ